MKIYLTRHGRTDYNDLRLVQGRVEMPLNETGIRQATEARAKIALINPDICYCSPLGRALSTAKLMCEGLDIEIVPDDRLKEISYGDYEGKSIYDEGFVRDRRQFARRYPNGESHLEAAHRIYSFFDELKATHKDEEVILIVAHGGLVRSITSYFKDMDNDEYFDAKMDNCSLLEFDL